MNYERDDQMIKMNRIDRLKLNNSIGNTLVQQNNQSSNEKLNSAVISTEPSKVVFPSRKRRSRNSQELFAAQAALGYFTTNANGQIQKRADLSCVVCHAVAHGYNFDAISCESCKAFFRRNALFSMDRLKCRRDGNCEITLETRRRCKYCRLKKCFGVGMRKEWILTEEEKVNKKRRLEENKKLRAPDSILSEKSDEELQTILSDKQNKSSTSYSLHAQSNNLVNDVVTAYDNGIHVDLTGYGWSYPLARKMTALYQTIHTKSKTALRLISFYKNIYDFDILNETEKANLLKTNLHYIFLLHASIRYDAVCDICYEEDSNDTRVYGSDICEAYGPYYYYRLRSVLRALQSIVQIDKRIMQMALVVFIFSRNSTKVIQVNESTDNPIHQNMYRTQNKYVENLWRFIEKIYGYTKCISIFSILVSKFLLIQEIMSDVEQEIYGKLDKDQLPSILRSLM